MSFQWCARSCGRTIAGRHCIWHSAGMSRQKTKAASSAQKNPRPESAAAKKRRAAQILSALKKRYPQPRPGLEFKNPWELLVATVLSAQCTDARVNQVTPALFARWPDAKALAGASQEELESVIHSCGFFRSKAGNLISTAKIISADYDGQVPQSFEALLKLPGIARKTANVVLFAAFGQNEGLAVDTHVKRISQRLGLTDAKEPVGIERDLLELFPREEWGDLNHRLVAFGREVCQARKPACSSCELEPFCPRPDGAQA